ncbi:hypothetical protein AAK706_07365 [Erysipelotrichaceae bacterium 66-17]
MKHTYTLTGMRYDPYEGYKDAVNERYEESFESQEEALDAWLDLLNSMYTSTEFEIIYKGFPYYCATLSVDDEVLVEATHEIQERQYVED